MEVMLDENGNRVVKGVSIINGVCVDPSKAPNPKMAATKPLFDLSAPTGWRGWQPYGSVRLPYGFRTASVRTIRTPYNNVHHIPPV